MLQPEDMGITGAKKVYVGTNGCIEAQLSSTYVRQYLNEHDILIVPDPEDADIVVFWVCGLTKESENDSIKVIKNIKKRMNPSAKLLVWGCLTKVNQSSLEELYDGPIIGPRDDDLLKNILKSNDSQFNLFNVSGSEDYIVPCLTYRSGKTHYDLVSNMVLQLKTILDKLVERTKKNNRYWIRVASGCTGNCTYCSEKCAWNGFKSRKMSSILSDFELGLKKGYNRFSLIATELGAYGRDIGTDLIDLLDKMIDIGNDFPKFKLVLNQIEPNYLFDIYSDLENIFATGIVDTINSPVQSGSNRILNLMNRRYVAEDWRNHIIDINKKFPRIRVTTHMMVGFPTETDEDFNATLNLMDPPLFLDSFVIFRFSARPGIVAAKMAGQIPEEIKTERSRILMKKYTKAYLYNAPLFFIRKFDENIKELF